MISSLVRLAAGALARTWTFEIVGGEHLARLRAAGEPFLFALWHAELVPLLWHHRGSPTTIVASRHRDGRYVSRTAGRWGYRVVEGSSRWGGVGALRRIVRVLAEGGEVAIAVDGPTGPRHVAKPGIVAAAHLAGVPILPVVAVPSSTWTVNSWDRFLVPRPFATIRIAYGEPLPPPPALDRSTDELENRLQHAHVEVAA